MKQCIKTILLCFSIGLAALTIRAAAPTVLLLSPTHGPTYFASPTLTLVAGAPRAAIV